MKSTQNHLNQTAEQFLNMNYGCRCELYVVRSRYLGDIACSSKHKCKRANGLGHEAKRYLIATISHCLDGLTDISVVVCHPNVLLKQDRGLT